MTRNDRNSTSFLSRTVLLVRTIALALFVLGALVGPIDVDGDGTPDVPVVFTARSAVRNLCSIAVFMQPFGLHRNAVKYASPNPVGTDFAFTSHSGRSLLSTSSLLRC